MTKTTKNILIITVIVILLFALICIIYQHFSLKPLEKSNLGNGEILPDVNEGLDNIINEILEENIIEPEKDSNNQEQEATVTTSTSTVEDNEDQMTPKETKAINLVKEKWSNEYGSLENIAFNISIQSDGKYLVTVYDTKTTRTLKGFVVDVSTEIVNEK